MTSFRGRIWRIVFADQISAPIAPARAPEGRFHHRGQWTIYTSLTLEGAVVEIAAYVAREKRARMAIAMQVEANVIDLRTLPDLTAASVAWQTDRARGNPAPNWAFSDAARAQGAGGILYPSR